MLAARSWTRSRAARRRRRAMPGVGARCPDLALVRTSPTRSIPAELSRPLVRGISTLSICGATRSMNWYPAGVIAKRSKSASSMRNRRPRIGLSRRNGMDRRYSIGWIRGATPDWPQAAPPDKEHRDERVQPRCHPRRDDYHHRSRRRRDRGLPGFPTSRAARRRIARWRRVDPPHARLRPGDQGIRPPACRHRLSHGGAEPVFTRSPGRRSR